MFAGLGAAGMVGLLLGVGIGDDSPSSVAHTTTIRVVETVTVTPAPTTAEPGPDETTTEESPVAPLVPAPQTTTIEVPPPPAVPPPPPTTVDVPAPRVAAVPTPEPPPAPTAYYKNCAAARAAGAAPLYVGDPGYRSGLDRDNDGIACE